MDPSESRRHTLASVSVGLTLVALAGAVVARMFVHGYAIDWPWMGLLVATLASMAAILINPARRRLRTVLNGVGLTLTFPLAAWVLWRILA